MWNAVLIAFFIALSSSSLFKLTYEAITEDEDDFRGKRITAYLNLLDQDNPLESNIEIDAKLGISVSTEDG